VDDEERAENARALSSIRRTLSRPSLIPEPVAESSTEADIAPHQFKASNLDRIDHIDRRIHSGVTIEAGRMTTRG
jgi:hypothetical protein